MTSIPHPMAPAPQEQKADLGERSVPLPAAPQSDSPRRGHGRCGTLTILILVLAFLAASFPARNSDLWFHLATGRLLANGQFSFGTDPFAYTTQHVYWACHSWLFDWTLYSLRGRIGDAGLIVLKALIVTALAGLLLRVRRPAGAAWLPAVCTTLAILAISPRLLLQPACLSYFLFGLTFWLLWRGQAQASPRYWPLLLVFVLWVNVDEWFLLGPLLAALFWLDERLQGQRRTPGWIVPVGFAVCLLNPYTYHAFTLPAELSSVAWTSGLREDARFRALFACPWDADYLLAASRLNAAVLSYYGLTFLGLASFVVHRPALRDWRFFIWFPFALLAVWQARLIPFFAIVAAPITALNWQDVISARYAARSTRSRFVVGTSYVALVLTLLSLVALTWLGWLAGYDREERHVAWAIQEDPSLHQAAQTLEEWRRQGLLLEGERIFDLAPESAHYAAWFCPGERHFFDHRYPLFPQAIRDYEVVCRALLAPVIGPEQERTADWQRVFRDQKIGIVVFYDRDPQRLFNVLHRLTSDPRHWMLLRIAGQALIAGWNEARPDGGFDSMAFDAERLAYGPRDVKTQREAPAAPGQGPEQLPARRNLWARLTHPPASPSWQSAAATLYLQFFQDAEPAQRQQKWLFLVPAYAASLAGLSAQPSGLSQVAFQLMSARELLLPSEIGSQFLVREQLGPFFAPLVERPPALPLLMIRAARNAVAANPEDANAWLRLGQAYLLLRDVTFEHCNEAMLPPLVHLRHVQIVTALEQALRLDPNLEAAHHDLVYLYGLRNFYEHVAEHRQEELRLSRQAGPRPGESAEEFAYRMELFDKEMAKLIELVQFRRKKYAEGSQAFQGDRLQQARLALRLGLSRKATDEILLASPADLLGPLGISMELELMLSLGRVQEVRGILNNEGVRASKQGLGFTEFHWPAYEWLHVLEAAAIGDYAQCQEDLRTIRAVRHAEHEALQRQIDAFAREDVRLLTGSLSGPPPFLPAFIALTLSHSRDEKMRLEAGQRTSLAQQADVWVLEGLLALEQGDTDAARSAFTEAHALAAKVPFASRPIVAGYLGKLKAHQSATSDKAEPRAQR